MQRKKTYIRNDTKLKTFGKRVRTLRQSKGHTMRQFADLCDIEYSQISRIERGLINTSLSNVFIIAEVLEVDTKELF